MAEVAVELLALFIYRPRDDVVGVSSRFKDVKIDALSPWRDLHTWWVPPDEVRYRR